jgi:hypothetical protein
MRYLCSTFGVSFSHASPVHTLRRQHYHISMWDLLRASWIYRAQSSNSARYGRASLPLGRRSCHMLHTCVYSYWWLTK